MKKTILLMMLFFVCNRQVLAQKTVIDSDFVKSKSTWAILKKTPNFVSAVKITHDKNWCYYYAVNDTLTFDGKDYFIFSLKRNNRKTNDFEITSYLVSEVDDEFYITYLVFLEANFVTGLSPIMSVNSEIIDKTLIIYSDGEISETISLIEKTE